MPRACSPLLVILLFVSSTMGARQSLGAVPTDFADELVLGSLNQPTALEFLPDGRLLFTEKVNGNVRLVVNGVLSSTAILTLTDLNTSGNERGLLGLAVDPDWPARPHVYVYYTRLPLGTMVISRYTATGDLTDGSSGNLVLGSRFDVLNDIPDVNSNHNAGTLRFGPDGMLYASLGEDAVHCFAQDSTDFRGTILRMDVTALPDTGSGPPPKSLITPGDNPFPPTDPELGLVFCYGLRNPFRFHVDMVGGHLLIGDVGQDEFEELDEASGGENFGWPFREGPVVQLVSGCTEPGGAGTQAYDGPIAYYDRSSMPSASIIGGPRYWSVSGGPHTFPPQYHGAVFFADYYEGFVRVIRKIGGVWSPLDPVPGQPDTLNWATGSTGIVDFRQGSDGALYYARLFPGSIRRFVFTGTLTGVEVSRPALPARLAVRPNPLPPGARTVRFELAGFAGGAVDITIFDVAGRSVRHLGSRGEPASETGLAWDGRDDLGRPVPAGVYYAVARSLSARASARLVLLR